MVLQAPGPSFISIQIGSSPNWIRPTHLLLPFLPFHILTNLEVIILQYPAQDIEAFIIFNLVLPPDFHIFCHNYNIWQKLQELFEILLSQLQRCTSNDFCIAKSPIVLEKGVTYLKCSFNSINDLQNFTFFSVS